MGLLKIINFRISNFELNCLGLNFLHAKLAPTLNKSGHKNALSFLVAPNLTQKYVFEQHSCQQSSFVLLERKKANTKTFIFTPNIKFEGL